MPILLDNRRNQPRVTNVWIKTLAQHLLCGVHFPHAELSIVLTGDIEITEVNQGWRNKPKATDVLSFPLFEADELPQDPKTVLPLGDIMISMDTASRQAKAQGVSLEAEVTRLLIHGLLHLLGYEHIHGGRQAAKMTSEENRLAEYLRQIGE